MAVDKLLEREKKVLYNILLVIFSVGHGINENEWWSERHITSFALFHYLYFMTFSPKKKGKRNEIRMFYRISTAFETMQIQ